MRRLWAIAAGVVGVGVSLFLYLALARSPLPPVLPQEHAEPAWFEDVTDRVGINFVHDAGTVGKYFMPEQVGSGAAFLDFNNDGLLDIYLLQNGGPNGAKNCLYQQLPDGTFKDVSRESKLDIAGYNMGVAVADINNDGWVDLLVTQYDGVKLFLNQGDGTFADVTEEAGLNNPSWCTSAAFFDYNRDGWLDLVVVGYVDYDPTWPCWGASGGPDYCAPKTFHGRVTRLYQNLGVSAGSKADPIRRAKPSVRFEDKTEYSGLGSLAGPGLGVVCADFTGDGFPDIFIANDGAPNRLWVNLQNGKFKEEAVQRGIAYNGMAQAQANMGIAIGDVDNDGLFDIFVTHLTEETNTLWKQSPQGLFRDQTARAGLIEPVWRGTGFGTLLCDFDHDGNLDLGIVNGRVSARSKVEDWSLGTYWSYYGDRNQLFAGDGNGKFRDISPHNVAFSGHANMGRGLVRGDFDKDGAQDLLVTSIGGRARLYRNIAPKKGHWLQVQVFDPDLNRDGDGAEIRVKSKSRVFAAWLSRSESYLSSSEAIAQFGLGSVDQVDSIEVVWPDGFRQSYPGCSVDQRIILNRSRRK